MSSEDGGRARFTPRRVITVGVLVVLVVLAALGSCQRGPDEPRPPAGDERLQRGEPAETTEPQRGGVLRIGLERPRHLDPALTQPVPQSELIMADLLFDTLTTFDPETGGPLPALAESWEASDDLRVWTFRLRPDATFADGGAPVTSVDVKYTLERIARPGSGSPSSVQLEPVAGFQEFSVRGEAEELSGVRAADAHVVEIELSEPLADLPLLLSSPVFGVVPRALVEADPEAFDRRPLGSGPFRLESRDDDTLELVRAAGSPALLDGVTVRFFDAMEDAFEAFAAGELDWTLVPTDLVEVAEERYGGAAEAVPYRAELFYGFNLADPKFADERFREAIVLAVDAAAVVDQAYAGTLLPLAGVVVSGVPGHQDDACGGGCDHDPERARALVAEVFGDEPVPEVAIDFDEGSRQAEVAAVMAAGLEAAGIPAALRGRPFAEYQEFVAGGGQELFRLGWAGGYPAAHAYLAPLFRTGSPDNVLGLSVSEFDEGLEAARREADAEARHDRYRGLERLVMARFPLVPLGQFQTHTLMGRSVRGLELAVTGTFDSTRVWLAPD
jgi:oligopeptide transport system substrate-binding protein